MLTRARTLLQALVVGAGVLVLVVGTAAASAGPGGGQCPPNQTTCEGWGGTTPKPPNPGGGGPGGGNGGGGGPCLRDGEEVPCYDPDLGWYNSADGCYYKVRSPQPAGGPEGQTAYLRSCGGGALPLQDTVWLDDPPPGFLAPPDPADLAADALAQLDLQYPTVQVAPDPAGKGLVGLPVWFWLPRDTNNDDYVSQWDDMRIVVEERGVVVTLTATPGRLMIETDDPARPEIACGNDGVPYSPRAHGGRAPVLRKGECGFAGYSRPSRTKANPDGTFRISATVTWSVSWTSGGESGTIPGVVRESQEDVLITVDELQVVTE